MHILSASDLSKQQIEKWFGMADYMQNHLQGVSEWLRGRILGTLFFEPSTRTRWSTESAMLRLGGQVLSCENAQESSSAKKQETLADTVRVASQYADVLLVRHPKEFAIHEAARFSDVPVINGGDGSNEHPTQSLLDLYTILRLVGQKKDVTVLCTGDLLFSRTVRSLVHLLKLFNIRVILATERHMRLKITSACGHEVELASPEELPPDCEPIKEQDIPSVLPEVDVLYMTRQQRERYDSWSIADLCLSQFVLSQELVATMKKDAIILHPLPRNEELPPEIDVNHRAAYFRQARNGLFVRMAILRSLCLGD